MNKQPLEEKIPDNVSSNTVTRQAAESTLVDNDMAEQTIEAHIRETIKDALSESLKVEKELIYEDESFADYGVDSITGVHIGQVINQGLKIEL